MCPPLEEFIVGQVRPQCYRADGPRHYELGQLLVNDMKDSKGPRTRTWFRTGGLRTASAKEGSGFALATSSLNSGVFGGLPLGERGSHRLWVKDNERCEERHGRDQTRDERRVQSIPAAATSPSAHLAFRSRRHPQCPRSLAESPRNRHARCLPHIFSRNLGHPSGERRTMFNYIFFLRPPPTQVSPSGPVTFTPQLANDLRTEDFAGEEEIFYSWSLVSPNISEPYPSITPPQKLTVWRSSNFKEFSVPLPPRTQEGQAYRLVLTARRHARAHIVNLAARDVGERPFPVMSMPIVLSSRARAGAHVEKQQSIERVFRVPLQTEKDGFLTIREQTSFDLDKVCISWLYACCTFRQLIS